MRADETGISTIKVYISLEKQSGMVLDSADALRGLRRR